MSSCFFYSEETEGLGQEMRSTMMFISFVLTSFMVSYSFGADVICPKGWKPIGCNNQWKCVIPMSDFEPEAGKQCMKKGGIPEATACLSRDETGVEESTGKFCIKDLENGNIGLARNLKLAIARQENEEQDKMEEEEDDENFTELENGDN